MNPISDIKTAAIDIAHAVEKVATSIPNTISLLDHAIKDEPAVKTLITTLVQNASSVLTAGTIAAEARGISLTADVATLAAAEQFFTYFKNMFLPQAESIYAELKSDAQ
ncbi:MAG: hypothetical protein PW792_08210 [Acidobacteriaceae bacterium]|nr:hypothetical protein [Acidobacteriaceae bacterium]